MQNLVVHGDSRLGESLEISENSFATMQRAHRKLADDQRVTEHPSFGKQVTKVEIPMTEVVKPDRRIYEDHWIATPTAGVVRPRDRAVCRPEVLGGARFLVQ